MAEQPGAAQDKEIEPPIVVVVRLDQIETSELTIQTPLRCHFREPTAPVIAVGLHAAARVAGHGQQVEQAVTIEVVHHRATGGIHHRHAQLGRTIDPRLRSSGRAHTLGNRAKALGYGFGVVAGGHRREVEQPGDDRVIGIPFEESEEEQRRLTGALWLGVDTLAADRKDAAIGAVPLQAVCILRRLKVRETEGAEHPCRLPRLHRASEHQVLLEQADGLERPAELEELSRVAEAEPCFR